MKSKLLNDMARQMVGDSQKPNLFFVTDVGNVVGVHTEFGAAYLHFKDLARREPRKECALEDRSFGVIASVEPESDEPGARLVLHDDRNLFLQMKKAS
jgi:hypothetical protein